MTKPNALGMTRSLRLTLTRIMSGGQTGVDRGALDAAIELGLEHGGWCPKGRRAEDGEIPPHYGVQELDSSEYKVRTRQNVIDSDGTLVLHRGVVSGGTELTARFAQEHNRSLLTIDLTASPDPAVVQCWLAEQRIATLNVAGPRESSCPGIQDEARQFLMRVLDPIG
jgi:hypothetical protein